ncbi:sugar ABC transporter permease [Demequina capsici]|uniref:Xylose transport system permease protein XylH n=1 Tax=Demequina capsici TaxID=3075620 RepID=A0AA96JDJ3_9MICO|nr:MULTISPECIES: multiple monosaccharide ABC transporter permease [unclassified Demequina]WNM24794.1 sugar ABC transporter permease [Demequina sp. OYTSA14]WNM27701.1 sugar ABC transporter permease [Demequina sp. PMTSA13]
MSTPATTQKPSEGSVNSIGQSLKETFTSNLRQSGIFIAFIAIVIAGAIATNGTLLSGQNVTNIVLQYSYILVLAIGMVIVIIGGHIDLSVGSVVAFSGAISAVIVIKGGQPWWVGVIAALAVGALVGAWQGFWVAFVGIPAFITTLAGMLIFRGATYLTLKNISLSPFPPEYAKIGTGFQNGLFGGNGFDVFTLVVFAVAVAGYIFTQFRQRAAAVRYNQHVTAIPLFIVKLIAVAAVVMGFAWLLANDRGLPNVLIILAVLIVIYTLVTTRTVFGRNVYAIGGNLTAATLSGVKVKWVNFGIMLNMGLLAGVAGVLFSARSNGAQPGAGNMFELDAIAASFIGGAAVTGGVGKVTGAMIGGLIMATMTNAMQLLGYEQSIQYIVKGLVLLLAVAFDVYNKRRAGATR